MGLSRSIPEQSASERAVSFCQIDFNRLCDNNDYAMLTANYNRQATKNLTQTITDETLRNFVLQAIIYDTKSKKIADDFEHYEESLELMQMQDKLQMECREYYNNKYPNPQYSKPSSSADILEDENKCFTARQRSILIKYLSENNKVYFVGEVKTTDQKVAINAMVKIFGGKESSYNNLLNIDIYAEVTQKNYNEMKQTRKDMRYVANTIKDILPNISQRIFDDLDFTEQDFEIFSK